MADAKLILKNQRLSRNDALRSVTELFEENGIPPHRLIILGETSFEEHLTSFNSVDIALDPFPYNGTMSTLDAIWMGVPVVTLNGNRWAARASAAIAAEAGLPDLICESEQAYIDKAVALASDTERLNSMKKSLRVILESSPVCDIGKFSTSLQDLYKYAWKAYCLN